MVGPVFRRTIRLTSGSAADGKSGLCAHALMASKAG